jgi:hypothetical protein
MSSPTSSSSMKNFLSFYCIHAYAHLWFGCFKHSYVACRKRTQVCCITLMQNYLSNPSLSTSNHGSAAWNGWAGKEYKLSGVSTRASSGCPPGAAARPAEVRRHSLKPASLVQSSIDNRIASTFGGFAHRIKERCEM